MPCRAENVVRRRKDAVVEQPSVLPRREQVSRGQELLQMIRQQPERSAHRTDDADQVNTRLVRVEPGNADLKVVVKHTFIEVLSPRCTSRMHRCLSDSALENFQSETAKPWDSEKPWQKSLIDKFQDMSDLSTNDSVDPCSSDDEVSATSGTCIGFPPSPTATALFSPTEWRTTVMLRNVPNNYTRDMLLELVDSMGFACKYDFAYLPIDFKSQAGLGYAFINFVSSFEAQRCFNVFEGFSSWGVYTEKVGTVAWGSPSQGLTANVERYLNSPVMHHSIPDTWKPALFAQGVRIAFPPPTKPMKPPKVRHCISAE